MPTSSLIEQLAISISGKQDSSWHNELQEIIIDNTARMPSMCTVNLYDQTLSFMQSSDFALGKELKVFVDNSQKPLLFIGEITSVEPIFEASGRISLLIHAYDKSHRLHRGKRTRTFTKQKDSDIIRAMLQESGVTVGSIDSLSVVHEFILQNNQTNMEWISMRAQQLGFQFYMEEGKAYFKKASYVGSQTPELTWKVDLRSFRPRQTVTHQPTEVNVHGWDPDKKQKIVGKGEDPRPSVKIEAVSKTGGKTGKSVYQDYKVAVVNTPVQNVDFAKAIASGYFSDADESFIQAEGLAFGNERIKVGHQVKVSGVGPYSGNYKVSTVRHIYRRDGAWETQFSINGLNSDSLLQLLDGGQSRALYQGRINGVVPAIVTNLNDPDESGKIKVKYPWMPDKDGTEIESDWVRVASTSAGPNRGIFWLPEVNDEVLVAFEHGDPQSPYIIGTLWNKKDMPPSPTGQAVENGKVVQRIIQSRSGHMIVINDSDSAAQIVIRDKTKANEIVIDSQNNNINVKAQKNISIEAGGDITLKATGKIVLKSTAETSVTAGAALKMSANAPSEIKINSPLKIEGASVEVKAMSTLALQGMAAAELKSSGIVNVQGTLIKLN